MSNRLNNKITDSYKRARETIDMCKRILGSPNIRMQEAYIVAAKSHQDEYEIEVTN